MKSLLAVIGLIVAIQFGMVIATKYDFSRKIESLVHQFETKLGISTDQFWRP